ncbi:MAG TPA: UvrD-helicase domain-containing protein, partial [Geobacteraceae bacterium]
MEAGIDPSYTLLDETGAKAELQGALEELLDAEISARTPDMELLLRHYPLAGAGHGKGIQEYLLMLCRCRTGDTTPDTPLLEQANAWQAEAVRIFPEKHAELRALLDEVERILGGKELAFHDRLRQLPVVWQTAALAVDDPETPGRLAAMEACIAGNWGKERTVKEQIERCLRELQLAARQWRSTPVVAALVRLSGKLAAAYRLRKQRRGALDFDDLLVKSRDLLARDGELRQELQRRFAVVMVDEFQDTNPIQKELVDLLVGPEQRLFIVGDPKQSIYLFRGADVQVFAAIREEIISRGGSDLYFQESFRSRKGIIDFVNSLFSRIMAGGSNPFEVVYREGDHLIPERRDPDDPPCVEFITLDDTSDANQKRQVEATTIAARIRRLVQGTAGVEVFDRQATGTGSVPLPRTPRYGDIAILFRRFSNLKLFERALRREGIPYYVVKGRGFFHCQEILDICSLLRYLEFDGDLVALAGVLRSPLCGVSDETLYLLAEACGGLNRWERLLRRHRNADEEGDLWTLIDPSDRERLVALDCLLTRLRPLRDRLTLAELLEEILTATDVASTLLTTFQGEQKVANLRKLIELSRSFASLDEGALRRFIAFLTELTTAEPTEAEAVIAAEGEDVVRLMTVHQSKGLEFPIVFV